MSMELQGEAPNDGEKPPGCQPGRRGQGAADHARKPQGARPGAAGFSRRSWFNFELRQTGLFWLRSTMNLA